MNRTRSNENRKLLFGLMIALFLIVITLVVAIFLATLKPVIVVLPEDPAGGATAMSPAGDRAADAAATAPSASPDVIAVARLDNIPAIDDPLDPAWDRITPQRIELAPQQVAEPMLQQGTVSQIDVQAAHDSQRYAWRLSWEQPEPSVESNFGRFSDAVAIQFPLVDGAPYTMGGPDQPVAIFYWRALWQKDVDEGFQDTTITHPNAQYDFYWFAEQTGPVSAADLATNADPMAMQWMIATKAGNPMADFNRTCPMEELKAQGFGSTTHIESKAGPGSARGVWHRGRWYVVFERRITEDDALFQRFRENPQQQLIALAVWDGQAQNRGGQKHISNWIPMRIDP